MLFRQNRLKFRIPDIGNGLSDGKNTNIRFFSALLTRVVENIDAALIICIIKNSAELVGKMGYGMIHPLMRANSVKNEHGDNNAISRRFR